MIMPMLDTKIVVNSESQKEQIKDSIPILNLPIGFFHFGKILIPGDTGDPQKKRCLISSIKGKGHVIGLCFKTNWHGIWFGITIDDNYFCIINNGNCLHKMGLIGSRSYGMPCYLPYYNSCEDLSIACNMKIAFNKSLILWMGNSHQMEKHCEGLHVYLVGKSIYPRKDNLLTCSAPSRNNVTYRSDVILRANTIIDSSP